MKKLISNIILIICFEWIQAQELPVEQLYVGTDRSVYVSGESIFLKLFYVDGRTKKPASLSKLAYVELIRTDRPYAQAMIELHKGGAEGSLVLPDDLPGGTYLLRAYTNWMKNFGPASFYMKPIQVINPLMKEAPKFYRSSETLPVSGNTFSISIDADTVYGRRTKVTIPIHSSSGKANLYAAVSLGEASGSIATLNAGSLPKLVGEAKFAAETDGHLVDAWTDKEYAGSSAFFSIASRPSRIYPSTVGQDGSVSFITELIRGEQVVVAQLVKDGKHFGGMKLQSPFSEFYAPFVPGDTMAIPYNTFLLGQQVGVHFGREENVLEQIVSDTAMFFGKPLYSYRLDDYVRFPTMEEVLREYVVEVLVQRNRDGYYFESISRDRSGIATIMRPVILLNGAPITANAAMKLDPLKVSRIDIYNEKYFYGAATFDGIISFHTYDNRLGELNLDPGVVPVEYGFIQQPRRPLFPEYRNKNQQESRIPDFRTTLYWNPQVKPDANGKAELVFFTSDMKGRYLILVEGMDEEGRISRMEQWIEVK